MYYPLLFLYALSLTAVLTKQCFNFMPDFLCMSLKDLFSMTEDELYELSLPYQVSLWIKDSTLE